MNFYCALLFVLPTIFCSIQLDTTSLETISSDIDPVTDQTDIDQVWEDCMVIAPSTISLLGQTLVVSSKVDVSFRRYSPDRVYKYIKYPDSFRATLMQISNDGYRAFLGAHNAMNRIQIYMQQIPIHTKTAIRAVSSKATPTFVNTLLKKTADNIERITKTCISLSSGTEASFKDVMELLGEVLEATTEMKGLHETKTREIEIELNVTRALHADMQKEVEERKKHYDEVREAVRKAQSEYSQALRDIPTGFKALALELGRAVVSIVKQFGSDSRSSGSGSGKQFGGDFASKFAKSQVLGIVSRYSDSINNLIGHLSKSGNNSIEPDYFKGRKVIVNTFKTILTNAKDSNIKEKALNLVQRGSALLDRAPNEDNADVKAEAEGIAEDIKPFVAAEQLSPQNDNAPITIGDDGGDSSKNELFKARLAQQRLAEAERRLDSHYAEHMKAMKEMRELTGKLASLDLTKVHFHEILEMLTRAFKLLSELKAQWHQLVMFFSDLAAKIGAGFAESTQSFLDTTSTALTSENNEVNRAFTLVMLNSGHDSLYRESYKLFVMTRTYYEVSKKFLMPRLAGLSKMLTAENDGTRQQWLSFLHGEIQTVQDQITQLINKRRDAYKKAISEKRAEVNEKIDEQGADGNESKAIEEGHAILGDLKLDEPNIDIDI